MLKPGEFEQRDLAGREVHGAAQPWYVQRLAQQTALGFNAGDANLYRYVGNGPTSFTDPLGLAPPARDAELAGIIDKVLAEMKSEDWKPTNASYSGAFGTEVHRRVSVQLAGKSNWISQDVYVQNSTNKVLSIGMRPPGSLLGSTQIDLMYVKNGYLPSVGDVLDGSQIEDWYDIKSSLRGGLGVDQTRRLKAVLGGGRDIKTVCTPHRYSNALGWHPNPSLTSAVRVFGALAAVGGLAGTANAMIHWSAFDSELDEIVRKAQQVRSQSDEIIRKADSSLLLLGPVRQYLSHFISDQNVLNLAIFSAINKIIKDD